MTAGEIFNDRSQRNPAHFTRVTQASGVYAKIPQIARLAPAARSPDNGAYPATISLTAEQARELAPPFGDVVSPVNSERGSGNAGFDGSKRRKRQVSQ
jgi:hypothetical protein